ncbi:general amidase [Coprinopsis cinerea okayama7|uniref:amidase n=1 Tax=Coprinopsis cinerea (strain Okayama-7 / 130 / ATCC MYA-4618 / FGSC 9003) TaxID=240176 RepID=A8N9J3_COPC7|nr:general amidase [Coprinopsis cinerea okayama7\|eukprot:XP_001831499.2 general amidase [Coprinopsis cinerea okayama7\
MWPFLSSTPSNAHIVSAKREERNRALKFGNVVATAGAASPEDQTLYLKATASEIVSRIQKGEWTASRVLEAYIARALVAQSKTNCLTEVFFERARIQAKNLDADFASTGKLKGPLHGVPVSIKDQIDIEGLDSSLGLSQWVHKPATENADITDILLKAGAILYVKTNVPQTLLAIECSNPVFGRTTNPYDASFSSGGSSGGEGALIAMDGAPLGIGSDIAGSVRIPAAYCGIYSFKPASGRLSYFGARAPVPGFDGIKPNIGPMGSGQTDIAPLPFRDITLPSKLKFGYYTSGSSLYNRDLFPHLSRKPDNYIKASPACKRAVLETVQALRRQGHECVEITLPDGLASGDGYKTLLGNLGPDQKESALWSTTLGPALPALLRDAVTWVLEKVWGDKISADTIRASKVIPVEDYWALADKRDAFGREFQEQVWDRYQVDGIICPVQALPQLPHGGCDNYSAIAVSTLLYNVLDAPVGCLPVTRVDPAKDQITSKWKHESGHGSSVFERGLYYGSNKLYDPEMSEGMPVSIQLAGKRWEDEKVLAMMQVIDDALGKERGFGPGAFDRYTLGSR